MDELQKYMKKAQAQNSNLDKELDALMDEDDLKHLKKPKNKKNLEDMDDSKYLYKK
jgi:hypothetical protein